MKIGDLVKCKLGIYGQGVIIEMPSDKSPYHKRITVYWLIPPTWTKTGIHTKTVLPSELEKICK